MIGEFEELKSLGLRGTHFSDALDILGFEGFAIGGFNHLGGEETTFGRAFTVTQREASSQAEDLTGRHGEAAKSLSQPGQILIVDAKGITSAATWGEAHTMRAMINKLAGVVIYGATRDRAAILNRGLPVLCKGFSPVRSISRLVTTKINAPVYVAGVRIHPDDLIIFDSDGLVVVPRSIEGMVIAKAREILKKEEIRDQSLEEELLQ